MLALLARGNKLTKTQYF